MSPYPRPPVRQIRRVGGAHNRPGARLPRTRRRDATGRALGFHPQHALAHLGLGAVVAADLRQPIVVARATINALKGAWNAPHQRQGKLRAEACGEVNGVAHGIAPAPAQIKRAQLGVRLAIVRHRRHDAVLKDFDRNHIFDADAHRVAGQPLGVRDHHLSGGGAKDVAQRRNFSRGAATTRWGEGLV